MLCHHHPPRPPGSLSFCFPLSEGSPPRRLAGGFRSCYITFALKAWRWEAAHRQRDDTVEFTEPMTTRVTRFPKMGVGVGGVLSFPCQEFGTNEEMDEGGDSEAQLVPCQCREADLKSLEEPVDLPGGWGGAILLPMRGNNYFCIKTDTAVSWGKRANSHGFSPSNTRLWKACHTPGSTIPVTALHSRLHKPPGQLLSRQV